MTTNELMDFFAAICPEQFEKKYLEKPIRFALANELPKVGYNNNYSLFSVYIDYNENEPDYAQISKTILFTIKAVEKMRSGDFYVIETDNYVYMTKLIPHLEKPIHFALANELPKVGYNEDYSLFQICIGYKENEPYSAHIQKTIPLTIKVVEKVRCNDFYVIETDNCVYMTNLIP